MQQEIDSAIILLLKFYMSKKQCDKIRGEVQTAAETHNKGI